MTTPPADTERRRRAPVLLVLAVAFSWPSFAATQDPPLAEAVKATYLYKFAPFVDWPAGALGAPQSPFNLCVIGKDPFGDYLDRAVAGQRVGDHPIAIRRIPLVTAPPSCAIAFVAGSAKQSVAAALHTMAAAATLTVTDGASTPGVVDFVIDQGRVRFRFDVDAAAEHGLSIRSQLLKLAVSVKGGRP